MATNNEIHIQENTRTSHKRWESMVVYALHYALRDVKIESQYRVGPYLIDAFVPALNIAIEIDEPHHSSRSEEDAIRESAIKKDIDCEFWRIDIEKNVYEQVDEIVKFINEQKLEPWEHEIPVRTTGAQDGKYTAAHLEALEQAYTPRFVSTLRAMVEALGFSTSDCDIAGHIPAGNGLMGFMIDLDGLRMSVSVSKSNKPKLLVTSFAESSLDNFGVKLSEPCKNGEYYRIIGFEGQRSKEELISYLIKLKDRAL